MSSAAHLYKFPADYLNFVNSYYFFVLIYYDVVTKMSFIVCPVLEPVLLNVLRISYEPLDNAL